MLEHDMSPSTRSITYEGDISSNGTLVFVSGTETTLNVQYNYSPPLPEFGLIRQFTFMDSTFEMSNYALILVDGVQKGGIYINPGGTTSGNIPTTLTFWFIGAGTFIVRDIQVTLVCVAHNSKIKTLQGEKYIQDLQRGDEIIGGKIARVIREELHPQSLVQAIFGYKDCLEENVPNQDTWLCAEHYIIYKGKRRMAKCFSAYPGVVYYENCPVYKILPMVKDKKYYFYDIQYEEEGEYVVNNLLSQSRSPFAIVSPLAKELYFNPEKYKDIKVKNALTENPPISFDYILPDGREVKSLVLLKERN